MYGDYQCGFQPSGSTIDAGAVCDQWLEAPEVVLQPKPLTEDLPTEKKVSCIMCQYITGLPDTPLCVMKGKQLGSLEIVKACPKFVAFENVRGSVEDASETEAPTDTNNPAEATARTCETCAASFMDGNTPRCGDNNYVIIDTLATCERWRL